MTERLPDFSNPPVIEVVLGVQFEPLGLTSGHLGKFWGCCLNDEWPTTTDAPALPEQSETFGGQKALQLPSLRLLVQPSIRPERLQIRHRDEDRMIQVQDTRFVYNWIKRDRDYPRYRRIRSQFDEMFGQFSRFVEESGLNAVRPNQWEVTYVNRLLKGDLWDSAADVASIFPGLLAEVKLYGRTNLESMLAEWRSEIPPGRGRLHVNARFQESAGREGPPVDSFVLHLTARGPIDDNQNLGQGLDLGHETIVQAFLDVSSERARKHWGETRNVS